MMEPLPWADRTGISYLRHRNVPPWTHSPRNGARGDRQIPHDHPRTQTGQWSPGPMDIPLARKCGDQGPEPYPSNTAVPAELRQKPDQSGEAQNLHKPGVHPSRSASQDGCNLTGRLMPMATWSIPTGPTVRPHKNPSCASIGLTRQKSRASAALGNPCCWKNSSVTTLQSVPAGLDIGRSLRRRCHPSLLFAAFMASCQDAWRQCPPHRPVLRIGTYGDQSAWTR